MPSDQRIVHHFIEAYLALAFITKSLVVPDHDREQQRIRCYEFISPYISLTGIHKGQNSVLSRIVFHILQQFINKDNYLIIIKWLNIQLSKSPYAAYSGSLPG